MPEGQLNRIIRHMRRAALRPSGGNLPDAHLLHDFITNGEEVAFEALVRRHGPMVLGVCRRVLHNLHDAEDAFQAAFLVLVRKAAAISKRDLLANWLYGVAYRTALQAKTANAKRKVKEQRAAMVRNEAVEELRSAEWQSLLDQELSRLPTKYRTVVVLCDLEGKTQTEAARLLGCPVGTVASRLARARAKFAKQLSRHGVAVSGAALGVALLQTEASAGVPSSVVAATVKAAIWLAKGESLAAGIVSAKVAGLVKGVLHSMLVTKLHVGIAVLVMMGIAGLGGGKLTYQMVAASTSELGAKSQAEKGFQADPEKLRQENERLQRELRQSRDEAAALKAELSAKEQERQELLFQGKPASYWLKQLQDRDVSFRQKAVEALGELAQENRTLIPVLIDCLKDRNASIRGQAAHALLAIGPPAQAAVPVMVAALKEPKYSLPNMQISSVLKAIEPEGTTAIPLLAELVKGTDKKTQAAAALVLAKVAVASGKLEQIAKENGELIPLYIDFLKQPDPSLKYAAASALAAIGPDAKAAIPILLDTFKKNPHDVIPVDGRFPVVGGAPVSVQNPYLMAIERIDPDTAAKLKESKKPPQ